MEMKGGLRDFECDMFVGAGVFQKTAADTLGFSRWCNSLFCTENIPKKKRHFGHHSKETASGISGHNQSLENSSYSVENNL